MWKIFAKIFGSQALRGGGGTSDWFGRDEERGSEATKSGVLRALYGVLRTSGFGLSAKPARRLYSGRRACFQR
jgi:hypothetical protein